MEINPYILGKSNISKSTLSSSFRNHNYDLNKKESFIKSQSQTQIPINKNNSFKNISKIINKNHKQKLNSSNESSIINLPNIKNIKSKLLLKMPNGNNSNNKCKNNNIKIKKHILSVDNVAQKSLLSFDSSIKFLYENNNKINRYNKEYQMEKRKKKKELNFDYEESNYYIKHNLFGGNNPKILKKKVMFVKNICDYIYPKIVVNRMKFIDKQKIDEINDDVKCLIKKFKNIYYRNRCKSSEENSILSKYKFKCVSVDESIKKKGNFVKPKTIIVNGKLVTQLTKYYDYLN